MTIEELGLPQTSLLSQAGAVRPPLVGDFLADSAEAVRRRRTGVATQVTLQKSQAMFLSMAWGSDLVVMSEQEGFRLSVGRHLA